MKKKFITLLLLFLQLTNFSQTQLNPPCIQAPKFSDTQIIPVSHDIGDIDGDGLIDVVTANEIPGVIVILKGDGNGNFIFIDSIHTPMQAFNVTLGDINNDNLLDIICNQRPTSKVFIYLNNALINFTLSTTLSVLVQLPNGAVNYPPLAIDIEDMDNDGNNDIIIGKWFNSNICIFFGDGSGYNFVLNQYNTNAWEANMRLFIADLNNDGKKDFAVANRISNALRIFVNSGNRNFQQTQIYSPSGSAEDINGGDFNNDGYIDLSIVQTFSLQDSILIYLNNGNGTFSYNKGYEINASPRKIAVCDINHDNLLDIIFNSNNKPFLLGHGNGNFTKFVGNIFNSSSNVDYLTPCDINNDNFIDIIGSSYSSQNIVSFLSGTGNIIISASKDSVCPGDSIILSATGGTSYIWSNGVITDSVLINPQQSGNYMVTATTTSNCNIDASININVNHVQIPTINYNHGYLFSNISSNTIQWYLNDSILITDSVSNIHPNTIGNYSVVIQDSSGCRIKSNPYYFSTVGQVEVNSTIDYVNFIYNNEAKTLEINFALETPQNVLISLIDNTGRVLSYKKEQVIKNSKTTINTSILSQGIYFAVVECVTGKYYKKIVVN